jgi:hypothetical protein
MIYTIMNNNTNNNGESTRVDNLNLLPKMANTPQWLKYAAFSLMMTLGGTTMQSCEKNTVEPMEQADTKLTPEQQAFADLLKPHPDGTLKYSILEGGVDPYIFKNFAKINLELVNAKSMSYKATPIIQKKSVADVLAKAKELNPGQPLYYVSLSLVKKSGSNETVLNATEFIADKDDRNPSTPDPWLEVLPEEFTMDEFKKYNPFSTTPKSYNLNAGEELVVRMYVAGSQSIFTNFNFGVNPTQKVN